MIHDQTDTLKLQIVKKDPLPQTVCCVCRMSVLPQISPFLSLVMHSLVSEHKLIYKNSWACPTHNLGHHTIILVLKVCDMLYHQNFIFMLSTVLITICLFWKLVLSLCSVRLKGHVPICSLGKAITYKNVKHYQYSNLQEDSELPNLFKEGHKVNLNDGFILQRRDKGLAHIIFSEFISQTWTCVILEKVHYVDYTTSMVTSLLSEYRFLFSQ